MRCSPRLLNLERIDPLLAGARCGPCRRSLLLACLPGGGNGRGSGFCLGLRGLLTSRLGLFLAPEKLGARHPVCLEALRLARRNSGLDGGLALGGGGSGGRRAFLHLAPSLAHLGVARRTSGSLGRFLGGALRRACLGVGARLGRLAESVQLLARVDHPYVAFNEAGRRQSALVRYCGRHHVAAPVTLEADLLAGRAWGAKRKRLVAHDAADVEGPYFLGVVIAIGPGYERVGAPRHL